MVTFIINLKMYPTVQTALMMQHGTGAITLKFLPTEPTKQIAEATVPSTITGLNTDR